MKKFLSVIILLVALMNIGYAQKMRKSEGSRKKTITVKTKIYCDHCSKCESCQARIENKILELKGIRSVELNIKKELITVIYNPKFAKPDLIRKQIASAGFDADDILATQEQINGLDRCCLKRD
jgi:periplasmic mercuric ion binding protein